jgi:hypothetical protein
MAGHRRTARADKRIHAQPRARRAKTLTAIAAASTELERLTAAVAYLRAALAWPHARREPIGPLIAEIIAAGDRIHGLTPREVGRP